MAFIYVFTKTRKIKVEGWREALVHTGTSQNRALKISRVNKLNQQNSNWSLCNMNLQINFRRGLANSTFEARHQTCFKTNFVVALQIGALANPLATEELQNNTKSKKIPQLQNQTTRKNLNINITTRKGLNLKSNNKTRPEPKNHTTRKNLNLQIKQQETTGT